MAAVSHARPFPRWAGLRLRLPILDAYLLREIAGPFAFALGAFLLFWALNIFFLAADYLINEHAPFFLVLRFVVFRIPQAIPMAFPFACLFATLLALGRLMGDNEITAMRTSGVSLARFALTPFLFGLASFAIAYTLNEYVTPWTVDLSTRTFYQIIYHTNSLPVEPQFFRRDPDTGNVFYVTQVLPGNQVLQGVQIFHPGSNGYWNETVQAQTATIRDSTLVLHDAVQTRYNRDGFVVSQQKVKRFVVGLPLGESAAQFMSSVNNDPWAMSSKQLAEQVNGLRAQGVGGMALGNLEMNLADKLAWPFACFVAVLLALPLALRFGRHGRTIGIALAILSFFVYWLISAACAAFGRNGALDPWVAAWIPNAVMGGAGLVLLWLEEH